MTTTANPLSFSWDFKGILLDEKPFYPSISSGKEGDFAFNTHLITLDASIKSPLSWEDKKQRAEELIQKGKYILWHLNFALNESFLKNPLYRETSLLAIEAFLKNVFEPYRAHSLGTLLFKGDSSLILKQTGEWMELFIKFVSYLSYDSLAFLFLDCLQMRDAEIFHHFFTGNTENFLLGIKGGGLSLPCLKWEEGSGYLGSIDCKEKNVFSFHEVGVCFPENSEDISLWEKLFSQLKEKKIVFRVISEKYLTEEWDQIDNLIVHQATLSERGRRKLHGFLSANGKVIYMDKPFGFEGESSLEAFIR